ncbi:ATP-binding protein [Nocardioides deserti]|uniref:26S protease regulatory subunit n=1 Tax=Nocardioides deserti TaxID=1588644 RepID=A0ABR6U949_9ACTN|nr:AAA family ATPase [Nocardioides deserti]MBC2960805.1 26S protease regulatory subunit [Nocardioides deserti]GGO77419.1 ATPase AAA [Nocardioides deserti]
MSIFDDEFVPPVSGSIVRVRSVDVAKNRIYIDRLPDGQGWLWHPDLAASEPGDVYFIPDSAHSEEIEKLTPDDWPAQGSIGTVVELSDDGTRAILEINGRLTDVPQRAANPFQPGQAVSVSSEGIPGAVLTTKPIDRLGIHRNESGLDPSIMLVEPADIDVELSDFGGSPDLVGRALDLARVALDPQQLLERIGVNPVKGILFSGPSGTGKTYLARALSKEVGASFYLIDGPEIINKWVGESEQRLRDLFDHAAKSAPALLFFDELDSIVSKRDNDAPEYVTRFVGQFLTILDGFDPAKGVLVIAATNLPGALDTALLRPGRLSFKVEFNGHPNGGDRLAILRASSRRVLGADKADLEALTEGTEGWTAAEMSMIWTEAGVLAALDGRNRLNAEDVREGYVRARMNRETTLRQAGRS